jgi:ABC-type phosphate/phosphonate transport system substrate-binding protein
MLLLSTTISFADKIGPYDRDTAYIGGLSRQLFNVDRNDITIATELFFKEVVGRIGYEKMDFIVHDNISDLLSAMRKDKLDTVFANPIDYLQLDHQVNPNYRYTVAYGPNPEQRIYLLTNSSNGITSIKQLKGKRLSIPKNYLLGRMFLEVQLAKAGISDPENFFSIIHEPNSTNAAILDLFFDKADLTVTSDISYTLASELNSQLSHKIDILNSSPPYIPFIIGVNKQAPTGHLAKVDSILLHIDNEPRLKHILSLFSATSVTKVREEQLQALRELKQEHQRLLK